MVSGVRADESGNPWRSTIAMIFISRFVAPTSARRPSHRTPMSGCIVSMTSRIFSSAPRPAAPALHRGDDFNTRRRGILIGGHSGNHRRMICHRVTQPCSGPRGVAPRHLRRCRSWDAADPWRAHLLHGKRPGAKFTNAPASMRVLTTRPISAKPITRAHKAGLS